MRIDTLDHVVLTVRDIGRTVAFYEAVLGMRHVVFGDGFNALHFGQQKINLHPYRSEYAPHADLTLPGSADLCFTTAEPIEAVIRHLSANGVTVEVGPVPQIGARGCMTSAYFRDPDANLVEVACYDAQPSRS